MYAGVELFEAMKFCLPWPSDSHPSPAWCKKGCRVAKQKESFGARVARRCGFVYWEQVENLTIDDFVECLQNAATVKQKAWTKALTAKYIAEAAETADVMAVRAKAFGRRWGKHQIFVDPRGFTIKYQVFAALAKATELELAVDQAEAALGAAGA